MSVIALILTALIGAEAVPAILTAIRAARGVVTVAKVGKAIAPQVLEGFRSLTQREDLTAEQRAFLNHVKEKRVVDLGGPMDKFA